MYVVMEDNEKETGTTKVCKPGSWAMFLRLLVYSLDSVTLSILCLWGSVCSGDCSMQACWLKIQWWPRALEDTSPGIPDSVESLSTCLSTVDPQVRNKRWWDQPEKRQVKPMGGWLQDGGYSLNKVTLLLHDCENVQELLAKLGGRKWPGPFSFSTRYRCVHQRCSNSTKPLCSVSFPLASETIGPQQPSWQVMFSSQCPNTACSWLVAHWLAPLKRGRFLYECQNSTGNCVMGLCPLNSQETEALFQRRKRTHSGFVLNCSVQTEQRIIRRS